MFGELRVSVKIRTKHSLLVITWQNKDVLLAGNDAHTRWTQIEVINTAAYADTHTDAHTHAHTHTYTYTIQIFD